MNQRTLRDLEDYVELAFTAATEARRVSRELEARVEALEDAARPSRIDTELEAKILAALERRSASSRPPDSSLDVKTANGVRVRGNLPLVVVVSIALVLFAAIWRIETLVKALRLGATPALQRFERPGDPGFGSERRIVPLETVYRVG